LIRVAVHARSALIRAGLERAVEGLADTLLVARTGELEELDRQLEETRPDLLLIDVPADEGLSLSAVLTLAPAVVALAGGPTTMGAERALLGGAKAILPPSASIEEIAAAAASVCAGLIVLHPTQAGVLTGATRAVGDAVATSGTLTAREGEVLGLMAEGLANKSIARRLHISEHTVKFHVGSILGKLNAESRTEAVAEGLRNGLITV